VVTIARNRWQIDWSSRPRKQAKSVATGCHRLPEKFHGKEGVDGSSPSEGSTKAPRNGLFVSDRLAVLERGAGMEPFMEPSGQKKGTFGSRHAGSIARSARWLLQGIGILRCEPRSSDVARARRPNAGESAPSASTTPLAAGHRPGAARGGFRPRSPERPCHPSVESLLP
jgi:hypothetical protein